MSRDRQGGSSPRANRLGALGALAVLVACMGLIAGSCSNSEDSSRPARTGSQSNTEGGAANPTAEFNAGAASVSILPTVDGKRDFLADAPGWPAASELDANDPGVVVTKWDQGEVDIDNGENDSAWVHDDLRSTAVAMQRGDDRVVLVSTDTYMQFVPDADEIERRAQKLLPKAWAKVHVLVSAVHLHHGPGTAFEINPEWYDMMADQTAQAVRNAVDALAPATVAVAEGRHRYGMTDARDPLIIDPRLNVMAIDNKDSGKPIATVVQWASHPETTLNWEPPSESSGLAEVCAAKKWEGDDCFAKGRYLTADYPGVLQTRLKDQIGGEVLYLNGAIGVQIGPGDAPTWVIDKDHPVTENGQPPAGAEPLTTCDDREKYFCKSFAKTESIGTALANAALALRADAKATEIPHIKVKVADFKTRLTNIGFRVLLAEDSLGWQPATLYNCEGDPSEDNCKVAPDETEDDPVITPLADSQVVVGDVIPSRITDLDMGTVGFIFMPGELPPELVIGLPDDFATNTSKYYKEPELHAVGDAYTTPGHLLSLVDYDQTFTVGLGTDELGYYVPLSDYRLKCLDIALPDGAKCEDLAARGVIEGADYIGGQTCSDVTKNTEKLDALGDDGPAVMAICRYGQALGRELGEPEGHYEETNAAGWDMVDDLWAAARKLYGK